MTMEHVAEFEELAKKSWQSFSTMKRFVSEANRLENASWRLWFMQRHRADSDGARSRHSSEHDEMEPDPDDREPHARVLCIYCEIHSASLSCHGCCHDAYCVSCFKLIHKKGHLATHTAVKVKSRPPRDQERLALIHSASEGHDGSELSRRSRSSSHDAAAIGGVDDVDCGATARSLSPITTPLATSPLSRTPPTMSPDASRHLHQHSYQHYALFGKDKSLRGGDTAKSWEIQMDMLLQRLMANSLHSDNDISVHNIDSRRSLGANDSFLPDTTNSEDAAAAAAMLLDEHTEDKSRRRRLADSTVTASQSSVDSNDSGDIVTSHSQVVSVDASSLLDVVDERSTGHSSRHRPSMDAMSGASPTLDPAEAPDNFEPLGTIPLALFPTTLTKTKSRKKNSVCANCNGNHITIDCPLLESSIGPTGAGGAGAIHSAGVDKVLRKCFTTIHNDNLSNSTHAFLGDEVSVRGGGHFSKASFAASRSSSFGMLAINEGTVPEGDEGEDETPEDAIPVLGALETNDASNERHWDCTSWMVSSLATELPLDVFNAVRQADHACSHDFSGWMYLKRPGRKWCHRFVALYRNNLWEYLDDKGTSRPVGYANLAEGSVHGLQNTLVEFAFKYYRFSTPNSPRNECWVQCETPAEATRWRDALAAAARVTIDDLFDLRPDAAASAGDDGYELGTGRFASVRRARRRQRIQDTDGCCALKIIDKNVFWDLVAHETEREDTVIREILTQSMLTVRGGAAAAYCPIIRLLSLFETRSQLVMELELMRGGDLHEEIVTKSAVTEERAAFLVASLVHAIHFCQENRVAHRDVKLSNLALDTATCPRGENFSVIKLADFGMAAFVQPDGMLRGRCGTPGFVAPEILTAGKGEAYPAGVDMFSIGVVTYTMLCGYEPFFGVNDEELIQMNKAVDYEFEEPEWSSVSEDAKDLITLMMEKDTTRRITPLEALQHPFLLDASRKLLETVAASASALESSSIPFRLL